MTDEQFWEAVRTMPFREADEELRARKAQALEEKAEALARRDGVAAARADVTLTLIGNELHRLNRINRDYQFQVAVKALWGNDAWEKVKVWMHENAPEAT